MAIAAVVVCHNSDETQLSETLAALKKLNRADLKVFIASENSLDQAQDSNWLKVETSTFETAYQQMLPEVSDFEWVWLLSAGQVPETEALAQLLIIAETSASAVVIAPKLTEVNNHRIISSYGLTLTPRGSLFESVKSELDQAQHDSKQDTLGACLEGALISPAKVLEAGGAATTLDGLAADLELSIRLRLRGLRVMLAPAAKIVTPKSAREATRAADFQLKLFYYSAAKSFIFWLFLPLLLVIESLWLMLRKQPEKIAGEVAAGFKVFFTAFKIWAGRRSLTARERRNLKSLKSLFATRSMVQNAKSQNSFIETSASGIEIPRQMALASSGAIWIAVLLLFASLKFAPGAQDVSAAALLPLGDSWLNVFTATGAGYQDIGTGFFAPSDPFNWVLLLLASITFWAPGFSVALLIFAAKSLAFSFSFKALSLFTNRTWLAVAAALSYAFWPTFTDAQNDGRLPQIVSHLLIPVLLFAVAKVVSKDRQSRQSTWAYTALAALAAAIIVVASPVLVILLTAAWLVLAIIRVRKLFYLLWMLVPTSVLAMPTIWYRVIGLGQPLSLLADPGLPLISPKGDAVTLLTAGWYSEFEFFNLAALIVLALLVAVALGRRIQSYAVLLLAVVALSLAWAFQQIEFVGNSVVGQTGQEWVNGSPHPLMSIVAICLAILVVQALDGFKFSRAAGLLLYPAVAFLAGFAIISPTSVQPTDGRVVPALVRAEAKQSSALKLLVIQAESDNRFSATLVSSDGIHNADLNGSYRFALAQQKYDSVASLAAKLISASSEDLGSELKQLNIGYVMVPKPEANGELVSNIESVLGLNSIGKTEFGQLWRVTGITDLPTKVPTNQDLWSITKGIQLAVLLLYVLLALPTRRSQTKTSDVDSFEEVETDA